MIVDSDIVINFLRGNPPAQVFMRALTENGSAQTHPVVAAEVYAGARDTAQLRVFRDTMGAFQYVPATEEDIETSLALLVEHRLRDGVGWPDCLIAATCIRLDLPVATLNTRHFRVFKGLRVVQPY
jgi:predicted nucleic acid-binding protein